MRVDWVLLYESSIAEITIVVQSYMLSGKSNATRLCTILSVRKTSLCVSKHIISMGSVVFCLQESLNVARWGIPGVLLGTDTWRRSNQISITSNRQSIHLIELSSNENCFDNFWENLQPVIAVAFGLWLKQIRGPSEPVPIPSIVLIISTEYNLSI